MAYRLALSRVYTGLRGKPVKNVNGGVVKVCGYGNAKAAFHLFTIVLCAVSLSGCGVSQLTSPFGGAEKKVNNWDAQVTEGRLLEAARNDTGGAFMAAPSAANCPQIKSRATERLLTIYEIGRVGDSLAVQHRGEITRTARECQISPDRIQIKYGFAGRVLMGPKGRPGTFRMPIKVNIADRNQNIVATQKADVTVTITASNPVAYFSAVREIAIPLPPGVPPSDFQVYVAFERTAPGAG